MRLGVGLLCRRLLRKRQLSQSNTHRAVGRDIVDDCQLAEPERSAGQPAARSNIPFGGAVLGCGLLRKQQCPSPDTGRDVARSHDVSIVCGLIDEVNVPIAKRFQCVCHDNLPWLYLYLVRAVHSPNVNRLNALGQAAAVIIAIFIKVFPLSGILFGLLVVIFLAWFGGRNEFRTWFQIPTSWWKCVAMALLASLISMCFSYSLLRLFRALPFGGPDYSRFSLLYGNSKLLVAWLLLIWTIVAFGEEIIGRGFLIDRLLVVFGGTRNPALPAVILSAVIFGSVHLYQGVAGVVDNTCTGVVFAALYLTQRRNLWSNFLAHGFIDSIAVLLFYFGARI